MGVRSADATRQQTCLAEHPVQPPTSGSPLPAGAVHTEVVARGLLLSTWRTTESRMLSAQRASLAHMELNCNPIVAEHDGLQLMRCFQYADPAVSVDAGSLW